MVKLIQYFILIVLFWSGIIFPIRTFAQEPRVPSVEIKDTEGIRRNFPACIESGKQNIIIVWRGCCTDGLTLLEETNDWLAEETISIALLGVSCDNIRNNRKVIGQVRAIGYEGLVLVDENQDLIRALGINVFPAVLITNGDGVIVWRREGYTPSVIDEIKAKITK